MISVLMNCYNGERYLRETIESLESQTFKDFEVVFIDNQSSDKSKQLIEASSLNVRYFKTEKKISLGEARKFGLERCTRRYVCFLDTDDIYTVEALNILHNAISQSDYGFVYGNQLLIDGNSKHIGRIRNKYAGQSGAFFGKLLYHWDIPLVATIVDRDKILSSQITFQSHYEGSEEFDFFLRIAACFDAKAIDEYVVQYRIHSSLSSRLGDRIFIEREKALNDLKRDFPGLMNSHSKELDHGLARLEYYKAQHDMKNGNYTIARLKLKKLVFIDFRYTILFIVSFFPWFWRQVQLVKYKDHAKQ